jgi:signal transduction histidine kinase
MHWKNIRILLVDPDDSFAARIVRVFQKSNDLAVLTRAHTLAEARAKIVASPHDIVITSLRLPDGPATGLLTPVENNQGYPVVVFVRRDETEEAAQVMDAGAADCYPRDGRTLNGLPRVVARAVREWHQRTELSRAENTIRKLRSQLHQLRSLATSGLMARGVAGDLERLLTPVVECAETALEKIPDRGATQREIDRVSRSARLANELIGGTVQSSGNGAESSTDIGKIIRDTLDLLLPAVPDGVEIRLAKSPEKLYVDAGEIQLYKVFFNLYTNAFDAMRTSGGILHVGVDVDDGSLDDSSRPRIRVTVTDTGRGMKPEVLKHAFDPFFTTKNDGRGAGHGLPETREFVERHGGTITVESESGKGTVFHLLLPQSESRGGVEFVASRDGARRANIAL